MHPASRVTSSASLTSKRRTNDEAYGLRRTEALDNTTSGLEAAAALDREPNQVPSKSLSNPPAAPASIKHAKVPTYLGSSSNGSCPSWACDPSNGDVV